MKPRAPRPLRGLAATALLAAGCVAAANAVAAGPDASAPAAATSDAGGSYGGSAVAAADAAAAAARPDATATPAAPAALTQQAQDRGISVEFTAAPDAQAPGGTEFRFRLQDAASGRPLSGTRPAAWLGRRRTADAPAPDCRGEVSRYLTGDVFSRADVDLNSYFVLALNEEASISVVDPLFGFGGSKLLALMPLSAPGADWLLTPERERLFVSMPTAGKVAVADTAGWRVTTEVATGPNPRRLQQSADHVWVADDAGVTRIDRRSLAVQRIALGRAEDIALDTRGERLAVLSGDRLHLVDTQAAKAQAALSLDGMPTRLAWSAAAQAFYALDGAAGRIHVVDPAQPRLRARIDIETGASALRFAPDGRHALIPNPQRNRLDVLDAATDRIVQGAKIPGAPDQVSFTPLLAYLHRRDSETVQMIALDQLGQAGKPLGLAEFPAGQSPLGAAPTDGAERIVAAPEGPAVLVANPADRMIYLYREGMAAPAGGFRTYGRRPQAVLVVDHGLREGRRGEYASRVPVHEPGTYDVALFVDAPRVVACFTFTQAEKEKKPPPARVVAIDPPAALAAGRPALLRFAVLDGGDGQRRRSNDLQGLTLLAPGVWQRRDALQVQADGSYELRFTPPQPGMYYLWIESASLGLARRQRQFLVYEAK